MSLEFNPQYWPPHQKKLKEFVLRGKECRKPKTELQRIN
jgi:hypothetical protein